MPRVVLAMSGGVDSSVAALLLKRQGHEVIGLFMRTGVHAEESCDTPRPSHKKGCCSSLDAADARRVADRLDIPFYALDFERDFERIIDYFVDEYASGRTPNPCVMCNNWLKFGKLWSYGKQLEADFIATGHYAQVLHGRQECLPHLGGADIPVCHPELHMAADPVKDQTYVLHGVRRSMLDRILFPAGGYRKEQIRKLAREANLPVFNKPDSQEICFVPDGDYAALVRRRRPELATAGRIVDSSGKFLTDHPGIEHFTIGQRKGLGFAAGERRFVLDIIPEENTVVIGSREECLSPGLIAGEVNWLIDPPHLEPIACAVKIRYRSKPAPATVQALSNRRAQVAFDEPQMAVTPGQAAVFYAGTRVLGGGWIEAALRNDQRPGPVPKE